MTVCKFGGSSVADAAQIKKVKAILDGDENRNIIVVSAPGKRSKDDEKITDLLYRCNEMVQKGESCKSVFSIIQKRFVSIADDLKIDTKALLMQLEEIRQLIDAGRGADYAASRGEYLSAFLISQYLDFEFIDAADCIVINSDGTVNPFSYDKIHMLVDNSKKKGFVFPGFYGSTKDGVIKTFTRGGSDITGSLVALAVGADLYENWTDVSGFLIADPRIVKNPKSIETITYKELRELSYMGASVLHEDAIFPVRKAGIPINIRNTNKPEDKGTLIVESTCRKPKYTITGIAGTDGFAAITVEKAMMNSEVGFCRKVLQVFEDNGVSIEHMPSGIDTMSIFVNKDSFEEKEQKILSDISKTVNPDHIELESDLALIAVVGDLAASAIKRDTGIKDYGKTQETKKKPCYGRCGE